ncbi:MAG: OadG family protein [Woeseiaceae bacterium]
MEASLINQGLTLMLAGMGTVFTFLTTLVIAMTLMSRVLIRLQGSPDASDVSDEEIAAISAAITKHRSTTTNQDK